MLKSSFSLLRYAFARSHTYTKIQFFKQTKRQQWNVMKDFLLQGKYVEADKLINQLDDKIERSNFYEHIRYLINKVTVQFKLRKYGNANLAIKNIFLLNESIPLQGAIIQSATIQLLTLQFLYQRDKQRSTSKKVVQIINKTKNIEFKVKATYLYAMSLLNQGQYSQGINRLAQIICTPDSEDKSIDLQYIKYYKQLSFISLISARLFFKPPSETQQEDQLPLGEQPPGNAIKIVKDYINTGKINIQQLNDSNPLIMYQQYNQYSSMFPEETKYFRRYAQKLHAMIAEAHLNFQNYNHFYKQLEILQGSIFEPWLKSQKFLQQEQYSSALEQFKNTAQHPQISPEYDVLKYEAMKYIGQILEKQQDEDADFRQEQAQDFRVSQLIQPDSQHLPYLFIPYEEIFGEDTLQI